MLFRSLFVLFSIASLSLQAQSYLTCAATANPPIVHAEGVAERTGDIGITCTGGQPNQRITGNLTAFLDVNVTNRVAANGTVDVFLELDNGSGLTPLNAPATLYGINGVVFNGLSFTL